MFWLEPRPELAHPQRGSPRMFRVRWIERYLSRVRPGQVLLVWVPVVAFFLARAGLDPELGLGRLGAGLLGGLFLWTLLEYVLHRWVFHFRPSPGSELQRDLAFLIHGVHHDWPHDADRLVMPPLVAAILAVLVGVPMRVLLGPTWFAPVFAGLVAGYLWYDMTHFATHHLRPRTAFGELQRRNHMLHHFKHPGRLFGVTSPLWDFVFGTWPRLTSGLAPGTTRPTAASPPGAASAAGMPGRAPPGRWRRSRRPVGSR